MTKLKSINFTKKDISKKINIKTGLSNQLIYEIMDDFISLLRISIKDKQLNIKNFGTFKAIMKKERFGRNPKNKKIYKISSRKSLSFITSKKLNKKISTT
tara:strand:+ start:833 stop:1132 length:300 start_codon:yes stop_codon:yes gene_type:complete